MSRSLLWTLLPILFGAVAVVQSGLNKKIGDQVGLAQAVAWSASVLCLASWLFVVLANQWPDALPSVFAPPPSSRDSSWLSWRYYAIPGLLGFIIVAGVPFAMGKVSALSVFVGLVAGQVVCSAAWDRFVLGETITSQKLAAGGLAIAAVLLSTWRSR